jgi:hypothetical protein
MSFVELVDLFCTEFTDTRVGLDRAVATVGKDRLSWVAHKAPVCPHVPSNGNEEGHSRPYTYGPLLMVGQSSPHPASRQPIYAPPPTVDSPCKSQASRRSISVKRRSAGRFPGPDSPTIPSLLA